MSNQLQITGGAKVRNLNGVLTGTTGVVSSLPINVANGIPQLDVNGKILVDQLPNSIMEYKGTWNISTNTPTLANGTGNQGDVYLVEGAAVGGTAFNFGAGPITFFNGDQAIYSGSIWQRASGATGTVTSVAVTESGDSLNITGSPINTSGTINIGFNGTNLQYVNGAGNLTTFPILTGYVPYTGATANVDLGTFNLTADVITGATGSFASNGGSDTFAINHSSGAGIALNITKGGNGEGLYINKTSGSGNAATIIGTLNATTLVKSGGTSSQFLKADGTVDSTAYGTGSVTSVAALTIGTSGTDLSSSVANSTTTPVITLNVPTASAANRGALSSADWSTFNSKQGTVFATAPISIVSNNISITQASASVDGYLSSTDFNTFNNKISGSGTAGYITRYTGSGSTIGNSGLYDDGTTVSLISRALSGSSASFGSSVTATSFVKTGGTSAQFLKADGSVDSSTYLTTSAAASTYQTILTNPVTGTGTTNYLPKFTGTSSIANSIIYDNSGNVLINTTDASIGHRLAVYSATEAAQLRVMGGAPSVLFTNTDNASFIYSGYLGIATSVNNFVTGTGIGDYVMANNSNFSLVFATNGSIKMKMFANGNLAVGTTTDSGYKLDVNGTGRFANGVNMATTSGNVGIGVTPSAWSNNGNLQFDTYVNISSQGTYGGTINNNAYYNAGWKYIGANYATQYQTTGGEHRFLTAGVGSGAGAAITFTTPLTIASTGIATFSSSVFAASYYGQTLTTSSQAAINLNNTLDNQICLAGNARMTVVDYTTTKYYFTITPTGNVGIGTSSPFAIAATNLSVDGASSAIQLGVSGVRNAQLYADGAEVRLYAVTNVPLRIGTNDTERMRITSGGQILMGTTTALQSTEKLAIASDYNTAILAKFTGGGTSGWAGKFWNNGTTGDNLFIEFQTETSITARGSITFNRSAGLTVYNTTSDYRLKSEISDFNALNIINNIKPKEFRIGDAENKSIGFIAHELQEYLPQAVSGKKDAIDENGNPIYQGVDYSQLTGLLVKAIQELKAEIDNLKNK